MKRFQISLGYTLEYADVVTAESMEEAAYQVMKKVTGNGKFHIEPKQGEVFIKEIPNEPV